MRKIQCTPIISNTHLDLAKNVSHSLSTEESPRLNESNHPTHK